MGGFNCIWHLVRKKICIWQQTKRLRRLLKVTSQARIAGRQRDVVLGARGTLLGFEVDADHPLPTRALEDCLTMSHITLNCVDEHNSYMNCHSDQTRQTKKK